MLFSSIILNKFNNCIIFDRCTPGSVLTPDNRKWLDNQGGDKSPEMSRRLLIGQQSFVLTRDGTLIETPPSSVIVENDKLVDIKYSNILYHINKNYNSLRLILIFKNFSLSVTTDTNLINQQDPISCQTTNETSSLLDEDTQVKFKLGSLSSFDIDVQYPEENCLLNDTHKNDNEMEELKPNYSPSQPFEKDYSPERDLEDLLSIVEPCQDASKASSEVDSGAASESADTSCAQLNLMSLTESELLANDDISPEVSFYINIHRERLVWIVQNNE